MQGSQLDLMFRLHRLNALFVIILYLATLFYVKIPDLIATQHYKIIGREGAPSLQWSAGAPHDINYLSFQIVEKNFNMTSHSQ